MAFLEGAGNVPQQAFVQYNDPQGNKLIALNRDGTIFASGVILGSVAPGVIPTVPVISSRLQEINVTSPLSFSATATATQMYTVSLYMSAPGGAALGHYVLVTIGYTCELGPETITIELNLVDQGIIMETYPLLCMAGTSVTLTTAYEGGATNDPYNISARIVQMP